MIQDSQYVQEILLSVWPEWRVIRFLGKGAYGAVYEIMRDDLGSSYKCALKILQMYASEDDSFDAFSGAKDPVQGEKGGRSQSFGDPETQRFFDSSGIPDDTIARFIQSVSGEIDLMIRLKGTPGIVSIEDYAVLRTRESCTILIRMEELESLDRYIRRTGILSQEEVVRLGTDLCRALEFCEQSNILHRDIKPGNIFYSERAGFKLGDFGISKRMESIYEKMPMSGVGTLQYMAPEIYLGEEYNNTADLYSLGVVLYTLLNDNHPPLYAPRAERTGEAAERKNLHSANLRRLNGEKLPPPAFAGERLGRVICRACDPAAERRYQTAGEFRQALIESMKEEGPGPGDQGKKYLPAAAAAGIAAVCIGLFILFSRQNSSGGAPPAASSPSGAQPAAEKGMEDRTEAETVDLTEGVDDGREDLPAQEMDQAAVEEADEDSYTEQETETALEEAPVYNTNGHVRILCKKYDRDQFGDLIDSFMEESGIEVTADVAGTSGYSGRLSDSITGSSSDPTLFMLTGFKDFEKYGSSCLDLSDCAALREVKDDSLLLRGSNGKVYGLPCIVESFGLLVNLDLLEQSGYRIDDLDSFDSLRKIAEDITSRKGELGFAAFTSPSIGSGISGSYRFSEHAPTVPLFYELQDCDFNTGTKLSGSYLDHFKDYIDLYIENSVVSPKEAVNRTVEDAQREFLQGKAVFHQDGSWDDSLFKDSMEGKIAVIPLYMGIPGESGQGLNKTCSYYWCVNKYASEDDLEAALQFLQWISSSDTGIRIQTGEMGFAIPYRKAGVPDNIFLQDLFKKEEEGKRSIQQYYKYGRYTSWINAMDHALEDYVTGEGGWNGVREAFIILW